MIKRVGSYIPWRERMDADEAEILSAEDGWIDEWLEPTVDGVSTDPASTGRFSTSVRRVSTQRGEIQRFPTAKKASDNQWGREFGNAQSHVSDLLAKLGNGR